MDSLKDIHHKIRALREEQGMTLSAMATKMEIATSHLSRMERGELKIPPAKLQRIANILNVSLEMLASHQPMGERVRKADPTIELKHEVAELRATISRIRDNVESFLLKNLYEYELMETEIVGEDGASERALERLFRWRALSNLLDRNSTNPDFFLTDLYHDFSKAQVQAVFPKEKYMRKPGDKPSPSNK